MSSTSSDGDKPQVLDYGKRVAPISISLHGEGGQKKLSMTVTPEHLAGISGVARAEMCHHTKLTVNRVDSSHGGMVSGLSVFDGVTEKPIVTNAGGALISSKNGAVHMCHVPLGTVTASNPGEVYFTHHPKDADALLTNYAKTVARCKYDPSKPPEYGVHEIVPEDDGLEPVYITKVGHDTPLGTLVNANPSLNKKDAQGNDVIHVEDGVPHHVLDKDSYADAMKVLKEHLVPDELHSGYKFEVHTPNPPADPYTVNVHMTLHRPNFVGDDGVPTMPDNAELPTGAGQLFAASTNTKNTPVGEIAGYPGTTGHFTKKPATA